MIYISSNFALNFSLNTEFVSVQRFITLGVVYLVIVTINSIFKKLSYLAPRFQQPLETEKT